MKSEKERRAVGTKKKNKQERVTEKNDGKQESNESDIERICSEKCYYIKR